MTILNAKITEKLIGMTSLRHVIDKSVNHRKIMLPGLSGYPMATHVSGLVMGRISLSSIKELLESIMNLRDLARLAADILDTIPLAKMDRHQLIRTEVLAFVKLNAKGFGFRDLSEEDADFVAYLITSSETPDSSWVLDLGPSDNRIINISNLYDMLVPLSRVETSDEESSGESSTDLDTEYIYDATGDEVISLSETSLIRSLDNNLTSDVTGDKGKTERVERIKRNFLNQTRLAHLRLIDHIFSLLMSTDIWDVFITPRLGSSTASAQNMERSAGLKVLSAYCHSLLMMQTYFSVIAFKLTYEKLQEWLVALPPLPDHIVKGFNDIVLKHDVLGVETDIASLHTNAVITNAGDHPIERYFFQEELTLFGVDEAIKAAEEASASVSTSLSVTDLKSLDSRKYSSVLMGAPISEINVLRDFTGTLTASHIVANAFEIATKNVVPGISRFLSDDLVRRVSSLNLRPAFQLYSSFTLSPTLSETTESCVQNGRLFLNMNVPVRTYEFSKYMRETKYLTVSNTRSILDMIETKDKVRPHPFFIINKDVAGHLRSILKHEWKSLYPSLFLDGDRAYQGSNLSRSKTDMDVILETISGMNAELAARVMSNRYVDSIWATYLSSFALMYTFNDNSSPIDAFKGNITPVTGYGMPYGMSYSALAAIQPSPKSTDLISIGKHVVLRMIRTFPMPSRTMSLQPDFYMAHPSYYFSASPKSRLTDIPDRYVINEGLLHMALAPIYCQPSAPLSLISKRWAFLNDSLVLQGDLGYTSPRNSENDSGSGISVRTKPWNRDKYVFFATFKDFGPYGKVGATEQATEVTSESAANDIITKLENEIKATSDTTPDQVVTEASSNIRGIDIKKPATDTRVNKNNKKKNKKKKGGNSPKSDVSGDEQKKSTENGAPDGKTDDSIEAGS